MRPDSEDFAWDLRRLRAASAEGTLVFVLGAGINQPYGLPLWLDLLQQLLVDSRRLPRLRQKGRKPPPAALKEEEEAIRQSLESLSSDPLLQAAAVRTAYGSDEAWVSALRHHLTPPDAKSVTDAGLPLRVIARMLVRAAMRHPEKRLSVLTFNFDDLLEQAIYAEIDELGTSRSPKFAKSDVHSVSTDRSFRDTRGRFGIYINHLHGFLADGTSGPILDTRSYVDVLRHDHWSQTCLEDALIAQRATALFLGLSIADPNLRFVLSKWSVKQERLSGFYIAQPPVLPKASTLAYFRQLAFMSRTILDLYDEMLNTLQLVAYHLSSWTELTDILTSIDAEV